jgi:ABC-type transport system involved in multi-copper enzyme maturation permease subunit
MTTNTFSLVPRRERGWRMGLGNMLTKEIGSWLRTRRWWVQCLISLLLINGWMEMLLRTGSHALEAISNFILVSGLFAPIAAVTLAQDTILGERHTGTAAWVLSKPLRRPAYILSKLIVNGLGLMVAWVLLPGTIAYFQFTSTKLIPITAVGFVGFLGLDYLNLFFYLTLAIMLATMFNGRGPVLGISLLVIWSGPMQFTSILLEKFTPWLYIVMPWKLMIDIRGASLASLLAIGEPLPTLTPIIATAAWCLLFTGVAIWRIHREEF